jgi:hypothetical protein
MQRSAAGQAIQLLKCSFQADKWQVVGLPACAAGLPMAVLSQYM